MNMNYYADAIEALQSLADGMSKRAKYKRYSAGMRSAFANRANGIRVAIRLLEKESQDAGHYHGYRVPHMVQDSGTLEWKCARCGSDVTDLEMPLEVVNGKAAFRLEKPSEI